MFELLDAIPVTFDSRADWAMFFATTLTGLGSVTVAISALVSSKRAQGIARFSESLRQRDEGRRHSQNLQARHDAMQMEYDLRLDDAISEFFVATTRHSAELAYWAEHALALEWKTGGLDPESPRYGPVPTPHAVRASAENVLLRAKNDYYTFLRFHGAVDLALTSEPYQLKEQLRMLVEATRRYRNGDYDSEDFIIRLKHIEPRLHRVEDHLS